MTDRYIIDAHSNVVPCPDLLDWGKWMESADRHVGNDHIGDVHVSTVFLGLDHSWGHGAPLLWETMIFGGEHSQYQERYRTLEDALKGHAHAVALVKGVAV